MTENLLDIVGNLYKFHEKPITYLYNTFHYYDKKLKRLVRNLSLQHLPLL